MRTKIIYTAMSQTYISFTLQVFHRTQLSALWTLPFLLVANTQVHEQHQQQMHIGFSVFQKTNVTIVMKVCPVQQSNSRNYMLTLFYCFHTNVTCVRGSFCPFNLLLVCWLMVWFTFTICKANCVVCVSVINATTNR